MAEYRLVADTWEKDHLFRLRYALVEWELQGQNCWKSYDYDSERYSLRYKYGGHAKPPCIESGALLLLGESTSVANIDKAQGGRVDAVAQAGRSRPIIEDMHDHPHPCPKIL